MNVGKVLNFAVWAVLLGLVGFFFYDQYQTRQVERRLREAIANLCAEERHAKIYVDSITPDPLTGIPWTDLRWADLGRDGQALPKVPVRRFRVPGREVYIDAYQIIFDPSAIREGDPLRGKALTLWKSIYGEDQRPRDGLPIDVPAAVVNGADGPSSADPPDLVPPFYRLREGRAGDFERRIWRELWAMSTDSAYARSEGVRTVQGTAVHKPLVPGKVYTLTLTAPGQILFEGPFEPDPFVRPEK